MPSNFWSKIGRGQSDDDETFSNSVYSPSSRFHLHAMIAQADHSESICRLTVHDAANDDRNASGHFQPEAFYRDPEIDSSHAQANARLAPPSINYPDANGIAELGGSEDDRRGYASHAGTGKRSLKQKLGIGFVSKSRDEGDEGDEESHSRFGLGRRVSQRRKDASPFRRSHEWTPGQRPGTTTTDRTEKQEGTLPFTGHAIARKPGASVSEGSTLQPGQFLRSPSPGGKNQPQISPGVGSGGPYVSAHNSIPPPPSWPAAYTGHNTANQTYQPYRAQGYATNGTAPLPQGQPSGSEMPYNPSAGRQATGGWRQQQQQQAPPSTMDFSKSSRGPVAFGSPEAGEAQSAQQSRRSSDARAPLQTPVSAVGAGRPRLNTQGSARDSDYRSQNPARSAQEMSKEEINTLVRDHRELRGSLRHALHT